VFALILLPVRRSSKQTCYYTFLVWVLAVGRTLCTTSTD